MAWLVLVTVLFMANVQLGRGMPNSFCQPPSPDDCTSTNRADNPVMYLADPCSKTNFYQCSMDQFGDYILHKRPCPKCQVWNQHKLTCILDPDSDLSDCDMVPAAVSETKCVSEDTCIVSSSRYSTKFGSISGDDKSYYMFVGQVKVKMPCPPGTVFDLNQCLCAIGDESVARQPYVALSFDDDDDILNSKTGAYVSGFNLVSCSGKVNKGLLFTDTEKSYIEIPAFSNKESYQLTIVLWVRPETNVRNSTVFTNGKCADHATASISLEIDTQASVIGSYRSAKNKMSQSLKQSSTHGWNFVAMVWNSKEFTFYLNDNMQTVDVNGPVAGVPCPLRFGTDYEDNNVSVEIDEVTIYNYALTKSEVKKLFGNKGSTL